MQAVSADIRDAFFDKVYAVGAADKNVVFLTGDMDAFSLRRFKQDFPERFLNAGVAEQNMINVASGLAACGKKVFVYGINAFVTMRCFEQIKINICSMKLPVAIIGAGAGFSFGHDGPTHHGTQDVAVMRALPEMEIWNPADEAVAAYCAGLAVRTASPMYIRLDKGKFPVFYGSDAEIAEGFKALKPLQAVNLVSTGFMTQTALEAAAMLEAAGTRVGVVDVSRLKPLNPKVVEILSRSKKALTLEEHCRTGGLGSILCEAFSDAKVSVPVARLGVPDKQFLSYGSREWFHKTNGLDAAGVAASVKMEKA